MELTYEKAIRWLDAYFEDINGSQGSVETVAHLKKYFTADFEFWMYTGRPKKLPLSREGLLMLFVHPGLRETISPRYYVIDTAQMTAVVQFEARFADEPSGTSWPTQEASAHYHFAFEGADLKIRKIQYWTQSHPAGVFDDMFALWDHYREEALVEMATKRLNAES